MNLPNKLSLLRIFMVPLFVVAYFLPYDWTPYVALGIFALAAFTDLLDGYIARKYNLVTNLGKLLDPIADKILVCAALFCVAVSNPLRSTAIGGKLITTEHFVGLQSGHVIFAVCGILVLSRELLIDAVRMIAASQGTVVHANLFGKIKTVLLNVSLPFLMIAEGLARTAFKYEFSIPETTTLAGVYEVFSIIGLILFACSIAMTILSGVVYIVQNKKVFADK